MCFEMICYLIKMLGTKFYNKEKIYLLKILCDIFNIEYKISSKEMEILIINKLNFVEEQDFEHEAYFSKYEYGIVTKIGKYILII